MKWNVWHIPSSRWLMLKSARSRAAAQEMVDDVYTAPKSKDGGGYSPDELEVRRVLPLMEAHGTTLVKLKPKMIWSVAMDDFKRREWNKSADVASMRPYAFHRKHVDGAESANDIIRAALADLERGRSSSKRDTRLLYADEELLRAALQ